MGQKPNQKTPLGQQAPSSLGGVSPNGNTPLGQGVPASGGPKANSKEAAGQSYREIKSGMGV